MGGVQVKLLQFHSDLAHSWFGSAAACAMLHHCVASIVIPKTCAKDVGKCKYSLSMAHFGSTAGNHSHPNVFVLQ